MFSLFLRPVRQLAQALVAVNSPRQMAWGMLLGMWIGLIPKENLLAAILGMILMGLQVSKPAGLFAMGIFSYLGILLDPFAHRVGSIILAHEGLRPVHTWLYEAAISPWLGLNNTAVVGHLLIGLYLAFPTYWLAHRFAARIQGRIASRLLRYRAVRWLRGAEIGSQWGVEV